MLSKPVLALNADRSRKAQENEICGNPEDWFDSSYFREKGLYAASFDFFVNWENESICDEVWIKRISDSASIQNQSGSELLKLISACDGREKSNLLYCFLARQRMIEKYMIFRDVPEREWESGEEKVVELDLSKHRNVSVSHYNAAEIQEKIKKLRRKPASIGKAGLIYSTSYLEGYLSKKQYFWPGDVDTVLYNKDYNVEAIIEFKKHTSNSRIPFEKQGIDNYLEKDILKYKSLAMLRDRFQTDLFVLYYPIPSDLHSIIIEKIVGSVNNLYASERYNLDLPKKNSADSMKVFAERFISEVLKRGGEVK